MDHPEKKVKASSSSSAGSGSSSSSSSNNHQGQVPLPSPFHLNLLILPDVAYEGIEAYLTTGDMTVMMETCQRLLEWYSGRIKEVVIR